MGVELYRDVALGDMLARYYLDSENGSMELQLLPAGMPALARDAKRQEIDSLIQVKLAGDAYPGAYAGGGTLRQGESVRHMRFLEQTVDATERGVTISTTFQAGHQCTATHRLAWKAGERTVRSRAVFRASGEEVKLELLSSFSLGGITPYTPGDAHGSLMIHRVRSVWSMEGRLQSDSAEQLQLEPSWGGHAIRCERFGQAGSMPVNRWFPWLMVEDTKNHVFWGAQIAHNASWQMELYRKDDALAVSGGLADQEFGQWAKILAPGEAFETPEAILTVCRDTSLDAAAQRLTSGQIAAVNAGPDCEQELPIIFNEYCTTWGCPSEENIAGILKAIRGKGFSYFVIDCGWFKADGVPWDISMGDYQISPTLFPGGLEKTVQAIRDEGMAPGIWFEIDNVGRASQAYQNTEHLLKRDGAPLTTSMRRFWDMRDPWVRKYLSERDRDAEAVRLRLRENGLQRQHWPGLRRLRIPGGGAAAEHGGFLCLCGADETGNPRPGCGKLRLRRAQTGAENAGGHGHVLLLRRPRVFGDPHHRRQPPPGDAPPAEPDLGGDPQDGYPPADCVLPGRHPAGTYVRIRRRDRTVPPAMGGD